MRYYLLVLCCVVVGLNGQPNFSLKTKFTVFNDSPTGESIVVYIGRMPGKPLQKNEISVGAAKNFYLPRLREDQPLYLIVESSSEQKPKIFLIWTDPSQKKIFLSRGDVESLAKELQTHSFDNRDFANAEDGQQQYVMSEMDDYVLTWSVGRPIKISLRGSLRPEIPEAVFIQ